MKKRSLSLALALMLAPLATWASDSRAPTDTYGQIAAEKISEFMGSHPVPTLNDHHVNHQVKLQIDGGTLKIDYAASGGDEAWHVASYHWVYEAGANAKNGATPNDPNPNPPTGDGTIGDSQTYNYRMGDWVYTTHYEYAVRDGGLGWHITSRSSTYKPQKPTSPA